MINDVSKTIKNTNNNNKSDKRNEKNCTMLRAQSLSGDKDFVVDCSSDFPIKATYTGNKTDVSNIRDTTKTTTTTTTKPTSAATTTTKTPRSVNPKYLEFKGETEKPTTSRQLTTMSKKKISPTSTTPAPTHAKRIDAKKRTTTIATTTTTINAIPTTKKAFTLGKNKCPASDSHEISSQRALKANTSGIASLIYGRITSTTKATKTTTITTTHTNKCTKPNSIQCKPLESTGSKQSASESRLLSTTEKEIHIQSEATLSLAAQKAQLRSEFFKDIRLDSRIDTNTECSSVPIYDEQQQQQQNQLAKRLLKRCSKIKLKPPSTWVPEITSEYLAELPKDIKTVLVPTTYSAEEKLSLIEKRKLELNRKFATQSAVKSTINKEKETPLFEFRRVAQLIQKFDQIHSKMIVNPNKTLEIPEQSMLTLKPEAQDQRHNSPLSDEGCNLGQSPYSTDDEQDNDDNVSIRTTSTMIEIRSSSKRKDKVARSASSDSALGLEVDDPMDATTASSAAAAATGSPAASPTMEQQQKRRMTLTVTDLPLRPALLPLAEPTTLPDSPTPDIQQTLQNLIAQSTVPSKVLLEERVVEIPEEQSIRSTCPAQAGSHATSRRESEQSCISDYPFSEASNLPGVRYVRTPSVVVSDYSDDVMCGITLEEIEYFRAQRLRRRSSLDTAGIERDADSHSDVSASSSCSNLYYCGSTISALDGAECLVNGRRVQLERKASDCSTCSASGNEDDTTSTSSSAFTLTEDNNDRDIADLLAAQHLCSKRPKKVGGATDTTDLTTCLNISDKTMV